MNLNRLAMAAMVLFVGTAVLVPAKTAGAQQQYGGAYRQNGNDRYNGSWDAPPPEFSDIERRGFRDGIEGARKDYGNHRRPNVDNREEYRHPNLPRNEWNDYRGGFRRGYDRGMSYLTGAHNGPMEAPRQSFAGQHRDNGAYAGPEFQARQRGFEEGMEGAIKDFGNHRRSNPNNRDEFRHPPFPGQLSEAYRDGFTRGYQQAMSELMSGGTRNEYRQQGPRGQTRMRGFQEGMEGAMHDFENHRQPNPENRDEYRHPNVPYQLQEAYRNGFQRGYDVAMRGLMGLPTGRGNNRH